MTLALYLKTPYRQETAPQIDELRRGLRGLGIETTVGTVGLKVDLGQLAGSIATLGAAWLDSRRSPVPVSP